MQSCCIDLFLFPICPPCLSLDCLPEESIVQINQKKYSFSCEMLVKHRVGLRPLYLQSVSEEMRDFWQGVIRVDGLGVRVAVE